MKIRHEFIPRFYGTTRNENLPVIEYINGQNLVDIGKFHFSIQDKLSIILQLLLVFQYLHYNGFVYRDLKPNNVMIDQNKKICLIDFDRMINTSNSFDFEQLTIDFQSNFIDPEILNRKTFYQNDIYSIGKMIQYIMNETNLNSEQKNDDILKLYPRLLFYYQQCTYDKADQRPLISILLFDFIKDFSSQLNNSIYNMSEIVIFYKELIDNYKNEKQLKKIHEIAHIFSLYYYHNDSESSLILGKTYIKGVYVKQSVDNAIKYF